MTSWWQSAPAYRLQNLKAANRVYSQEEIKVNEFDLIRRILTILISLLHVVCFELPVIESSKHGKSNTYVRRSYALSWKPCQGDSLNLPDHRIRRRCCSLIPAKSDS
ncbi:hypothetical protein Tco_0533676 [Tanacetum coccineum]